MVPSSSRIALVEASHLQFVYFLCPPPSHHHFNLRMSLLFLFYMHCFLICFHTFRLILTFCNMLYRCFNVFGVVSNTLTTTGLLSLAYPIVSSVLFSDRYNLSSLSYFHSAIKRACKVNNFALIFGLIYYYHIRCSCLNDMISLYCIHPIKSSKNHYPLFFYLHQNQFFFILPNVSFCPTSHASFYTFFVATCAIHRLVPLSHPLNHTICTYFQLESCLFLPLLGLDQWSVLVLP